MRSLLTLVNLIAGMIALVPLMVRSGEHPLKNAVPGDWVKYKVTWETGGKKQERTDTCTVTKNDGKIVSFDTEIRSNNSVVKGDVSLYLDEPCEPEDPASPLNYVQVKNAKLEVLGEGEETLEVDGKKYPCHWVKRKIYFETGTERSAYESKVWICKSLVPLFGCVKKEYVFTIPVASVKIHELIGYGKQDAPPKPEGKK